MTDEDIRWLQRFRNFQRAFALLEDAVHLYEENGLSDLEEQGLIQRFEFTHELAWNVLKDYFEHQGKSNITGSRDATREAFGVGIIKNGDGWMEMIKSRNQSSHTYEEEVARQLTSKIVKTYYPLFLDFKNKMHSLA